MKIVCFSPPSLFFGCFSPALSLGLCLSVFLCIHKTKHNDLNYVLCTLIKDGERRGLFLSFSWAAQKVLFKYRNKRCREKKRRTNEQSSSTQEENNNNNRNNNNNVVDDDDGEDDECRFSFPPMEIVE